LLKNRREKVLKEQSGYVFNEVIMRDLLFKNLTSNSKRRKIIASSEVLDQQGVRSIIHRHFIYTIKEVKDNTIQKPQPYLYVLKEHNNIEHREKFFCRIKGSVYVLNQGKLYLVLFMHSLKITLVPTLQGLPG
jgi:hypothetical protein